MIPKSGCRFSDKIMLKRTRGIAPETCKAVKPMVGCSRNGLLPHRSDRHHKLPTSSGRTMPKEVYRFASIALRAGKLRITGAVAMLLLGSIALAAAADAVGDFFKGRAIDLYIGYSVGGAYDLYARVIGRHLGAHIPGNPTLVPKNLEGAGSLRLANYLYRVAPHDGSAIGTIGRGIPFDPLLIGQGDAFDAQKFNWIGSANNEVSVCVAMRQSGITKFEDLFSKDLTVGGTGTSADTDQFPRVLNSVLGTHFKIVEGYPGGNDVVLAMERGEVAGRCGWSWSSVKSTHKSWIDDRRMVVLIQLSLAKHPELPDVPLVMDFAKTDEQRQILKLAFARNVMGRPYLAPPNVPADRVAALRDAFMTTMADKDFRAETDKLNLEINPVSGADVEKLVKDVYATPPDVIAKAKAAAAAGK
jgi:tripartite-type tricarboxylate transporter receptor subunit TctC